MKTGARGVLLGVCLAAILATAGGQFVADEIAQREKWEDFLGTAEIVKYDLVGEGVTKPWRLYLKKGDVEKRAVWKNIDERLSGGGRDSWKYEIAAYRIDKLIGLNMVPPVVEREFRGKKGCLSLWADDQISLLDVMEKGIRIPESAYRHYEDMGYVYRLWCSLIANDDPTQENIRYTVKDWRMILIDHSRAFRSDKKYTKNLVFGVNGIKKAQADGRPFLILRVPRALLERIKALDAAALKAAVGPYLTDKEIDSIIARRQLIVDEVAEMIRQYGEAKVLY
jgi:hypothetical protein